VGLAADAEHGDVVRGDFHREASALGAAITAGSEVADLERAGGNETFLRESDFAGSFEAVNPTKGGVAVFEWFPENDLVAGLA